MPEKVFEALEPRLALYQNPMLAGAPPLASLENVNDSVVRVDTNLGRFDIELFDSLAPVTVAARAGLADGAASGTAAHNPATVERIAIRLVRAV